MVQAEKHTPLPSLPGDTHQAPSGGSCIPHFRFPGAWGLRGRAASQPGPGGRGRGAGSALPGTAGNFPPPRQRDNAAAGARASAQGGRPIGGAAATGRAVPAPLREDPHPPHLGARRGGADPPRAFAWPCGARGPPTGDAAGIPAGASPRGGRAGGADAPGRPRAAPPSPSGRPQLTGTGRAAGHYSIAGSAPRRPRGRSRLGEGRAAGGRRGPGCRAQRPRGGGERGSGARRRKGRATMCRGEEAAAARAARTIPRGGGGRGFQEIQTLRQEIGILTKHSRPVAAPRRGLPPRLTLGPPARGRGAGGVPHTPAGLPPPCPAVEGWDLST